MKKATLIQRIFTSLGENNHPTIAVVAIAVCKGTFRPLMTMMDKKQDIESRKYAAFREGVTEVIAIPTYIAAGMLAHKISPKFLHNASIKAGNLVLNKENRAKFDKILDIKKNLLKEGKPAEEIKIAIDKAVKNLGDEVKLFDKYKVAKTIVGQTSSFVGVCIAALFAIPALCNVFLPHIMKGFNNIQNFRKKTNLPVDNKTHNQITSINNNTQLNQINRPNSLNTYQMLTTYKQYKSRCLI